MKALWQATTWLILGMTTILAAESGKAFSWTPLRVQQSMFSRDLGMLDTEREEYATNLASLATNQIADSKATTESLSDARRLVALALHLSPRNKRAIVANFQLSKGIIPEPSEGIYSSQVFARLLLTRGQLLEKQANGENHQLARIFIQLAAILDPKNEDAVYASEVHRLDHGDVDWNLLTDPKSEPESKPDSE